jgi:hypothetical protein
MAGALAFAVDWYAPRCLKNRSHQTPHIRGPQHLPNPRRTYLPSYSHVRSPLRGGLGRLRPSNKTRLSPSPTSCVRQAVLGTAPSPQHCCRIGIFLARVLGVLQLERGLQPCGISTDTWCAIAISSQGRRQVMWTIAECFGWSVTSLCAKRQLRRQRARPSHTTAIAMLPPRCRGGGYTRQDGPAMPSWGLRRRNARQHGPRSPSAGAQDKTPAGTQAADHAW